MIRSSFFTVAAVIGFSSFAVVKVSATSTLQFSNVGRLTGFSAHGDVDGTDGMRWGLVIDTARDGWAGMGTSGSANAAKYDAFDNSVSQFLSVGGVVTTDYYFTPAALPTTSTQSALNLDLGGVGGIVSAVGVPNGTDVSRPAGFDTGDPFAVIWFDGASIDGNYYGLYSNFAPTSPTGFEFILPASGSLVSYSSPFNSATPEAIKQANIQFGSVPEPSRVMLLGLGGLGLVFRRRRC